MIKIINLLLRLQHYVHSRMALFLKAQCLATLLSMIRTSL